MILEVLTKEQRFKTSKAKPYSVDNKITEEIKEPRSICSHWDETQHHHLIKTVTLFVLITVY